jgi:hypothetical protein
LQFPPFGACSLLPHGHIEKTNALRADILSSIFIYRMDIKTKKEKHKKFNNVHPETPIRTLKELFFVSDGQGVLLKNHPLNPCKTFYLKKTV